MSTIKYKGVSNCHTLVSIVPRPSLPPDFDCTATNQKLEAGKNEANISWSNPLSNLVPPKRVLYGSCMFSPRPQGPS